MKDNNNNKKWAEKVTKAKEGVVGGLNHQGDGENNRLRLNGNQRLLGQSRNMHKVLRKSKMAHTRTQRPYLEQITMNE